MEKKKTIRKPDWLNIIGILLILTGLTIGGIDLFTKYTDRRDQAQELQDFMKAPQLTDTSEMPEEDANKNVWGAITIDKLGVNHLIAKTNDWSYLNRYVVAYESSPNPPENGNFAIAGHNGNCASCVFRDFDKLETGDTVKLDDKVNTYVYKIEKIFTVFHTDVSVLDHTPNEATLTLITCTRQSTEDEYRTIVKATLVETIPN